MWKQSLANFSVGVEVTGALNLEQRGLWFKDTGEENEKIRYLMFGIVSTTITVFITVLSHSKFPLLKI